MNTNIQNDKTKQQTSCIRYSFSPGINNATNHQNRKNYYSKSAIFLFLVIAFVFNNAFALELGVGTHFGQGRGDPASAFAWMKSAEMRSFRDEIYWNNIEHNPGQFQPSPNAIKSLQAFSNSNIAGINPILILSYGNPLYDNGLQPYTSAGRNAFAAYTRWIAQQLNGKVNYFEVWNEWNIGTGSPSGALKSPTDYTLLASAAYDAIKSVNSANKVIVGAVGDDLNNWSWTRAAVNAGLLRKADGVSVHLYNADWGGNSQFGSHELVDRLAALQVILRAANGGKAMPIYVTETGSSTNIGTSKPLGVPETVQAEQYARFVLESQTITDLAGIWFYDLVNDGTDATDRESNFGLLRTNLTEKPAGCRLRSLVPFVRQASLTQKVSNGNAQALKFTGKDGRTLLAVWAGDNYGDGYTDPVSDIVVTGNFASVTAFDQVCGDRVIDGFKGASTNSIKIQAGSYPTLVWVDSNATITGIAPPPASPPVPTLPDVIVTSFSYANGIFTSTIKTVSYTHLTLPTIYSV